MMLPFMYKNEQTNEHEKASHMLQFDTLVYSL